MKLQRKPLKVIITLGLHIFYHNNRLLIVAVDFSQVYSKWVPIQSDHNNRLKPLTVTTSSSYHNN